MRRMTEMPLTAWPAAHDPFRAAETLAHALTNVLRLARAVAESERPVVLDGLDGQIGLLCAKTLDLEPAQGRALRPVLAALLDEVEYLQAIVQNLHGPPPPCS